MSPYKGIFGNAVSGVVQNCQSIFTLTIVLSSAFGCSTSKYPRNFGKNITLLIIGKAGKGALRLHFLVSICLLEGSLYCKPICLTENLSNIGRPSFHNPD